MTDPVIEVTQLTHHYNGHAALDQLSFTAQKGTVVGLLGPNGAGKTTTVRLLNGLFPPTSGQMRVLGLDPARQGGELRRRTGVLTETPALYERLTARQNLAFFGTLCGLSAAEVSARSQELLDFFDLRERANDRVQTYSKGMKQRLAIARALLNRPQILFLDEPTSGLDPEASQQVHELIANIRDQDGQTVILCTHNLFEAERLCDQVGILNRGRLLDFGSLAELRQRHAPGLWLQVRFYQSAPAAIPSISGLMEAVVENELTWRLKVSEEAAIPALVSQMAASGAQILSLQPQSLSLEDVYFKLQNAQKEGVQ